MGKKSKRRQAKPSVAIASKSNPSDDLPVNGSHHPSNIAPLHPNLPFPEGGWEMEHYAAEKSLKKKQKSSSTTRDTLLQALVRACHANRMLRQWERLKMLTDKALSVLANISKENNKLDNGDMKKDLLIYRNEAATVLAKPSLLNEESIQSYLKLVASGKRTGDGDTFEQLSFKNLNLLQFAVLKGDVRLMEKVVSLGFAIDYPPPLLKDSRMSFSLEEEPAPPDASALVIACAFLAQVSVVQRAGIGPMDNFLLRGVDGILECAIQLVRLGADTRIKLVIPNHFRGRVALMWQQFNLNGKTAKELANMSGKRELINAMDQFQDMKSSLDLFHCRCGSRLKWKDCHIGILPKETIAIPKKGEEGCFIFRFSPMALCPCKGPKNRKYYDCCWEGSRPSFQDDRTAKLKSQAVISTSEPGGEALVCA